MSAWPSPDFVLDSRRLLSPNLPFVAVLVLEFWNWGLGLHQGKFLQHLKCNSPNIFVRWLWMVCLDKHPWVGTLRYNQLELSGCQFLLPTTDSRHHQLDERQTHRTLKKDFRIQAFGIQLELFDPNILHPNLQFFTSNVLLIFRVCFYFPLIINAHSDSIIFTFSSNFLGVPAKIIIFTLTLNWNNYGTHILEN